MEFGSVNRWYLPGIFDFSKSMPRINRYGGFVDAFPIFHAQVLFFSKVAMAGNFCHTLHVSQSDFGRSESRPKLEV